MVDKNKQYLCALDIGTSKIVALIGEVQDDNEIDIIGLGQAPSSGLRHGMVTNIDATAIAIKQAIEEAELMASCTVQGVIVGIAGNHIRSLNSQGMVKIKGSEVTQHDIERATETAQAINLSPDHEVLHTITQEFIIDSQPGVKEPLGMSGSRLETRVHIITGAVTAIQNLQKCVERVGLVPEMLVLQPLASARAVLSDDERELGVCCIDIGGGTTDMAVYTGGAIRHTAVIPLAGDSITKDLTQALRTPYKAAEYIKIHHGVAVDTLDELDEMIEVPSVGDRQSRQISRRTLVSVIGPRTEEILEVVQNELYSSGYPEETLTSGIVLTGGTSMLTGIVDLAEDLFNLSVRVGMPKEMGGLSDRVRNPRYATAIGLLYHYFDEIKQYRHSEEQENEDLLEKMVKWVKMRF